MPKCEPIDLVRHVQRMLNNARDAVVSESDAIELCEIARALCSASFTDVRWQSDVEAVGMMMPLVTKFRNIRPMDFAAVSLKCVAGGLINDVRKDAGKNSYLRYEHPTDMSSNMRVRLGRIIMDAPRGANVRFVGDYHDYYRENLSLTRPRRNSEADPELGRDAGIALARELYEANKPLTLAYLSGEGFATLLRDVLATADLVHGGMQLAVV